MSEQKFDFGKCKYGLFVHYVHGLSFFSDGRRPRDLSETVASFDAEGFAKDIAETGVQFLIFTAWHMNTVPLYPSKVNARWRGIEPIERDLLGEIIDAVNRIEGPVTEETFRNYLYAPDVPDPDLIIRTSGEYRVSNFLLWESAYSEYYFTDRLWPDFSEDEFDRALESYAGRNRRRGGV